MSEYVYATNGEPVANVDGSISLAREEVVRCRDCRAMRVKYGNTGIECWMSGEPFTVEPDGFCAWGTKTDFVTCKCGEDIERIGRIQTCPSCGRRLMT